MAMTDLQLAVLTSLSSERRHGYAVVQAVQEILHRNNVPLTTVYSCLEALAGRGLVEPHGDEVVNGRARRYFRITSAGRQALESRAAELAYQVNAVRTYSVPSGGEALA